MTPLPRLNALIARLAPLAAQCPTSPEYWLDLGDSETEDSYCGACADQMLDGLQMVDPGGTYTRYGGYCQEKDLLEHCALCQVLLEGTFTDYGLGEELEYCLRDLDALLPLTPETAWYLIAAVEGFAYTIPWPREFLRLVDWLEAVAPGGEEERG